jgi:hypothetical protein
MTINLNNVNSTAMRRAVIVICIIPVAFYAIVSGAWREFSFMCKTAASQWKHR